MISVTWVDPRRTRGLPSRHTGTDNETSDDGLSRVRLGAKIPLMRGSPLMVLQWWLGEHSRVAASTFPSVGHLLETADLI